MSLPRRENAEQYGSGGAELRESMRLNMDLLGQAVTNRMAIVNVFSG
jgi:hypothetical protein